MNRDEGASVVGPGPLVMWPSSKVVLVRWSSGNVTAGAVNRDEGILSCRSWSSGDVTAGAVNRNEGGLGCKAQSVAEVLSRCNM